MAARKRRVKPLHFVAADTHPINPSVTALIESMILKAEYFAGKFTFNKPLIHLEPINKWC